jgi:hypothetical protein
MCVTSTSALTVVAIFVLLLLMLLPPLPLLAKYFLVLQYHCQRMVMLCFGSSTIFAFGQGWQS